MVRNLSSVQKLELWEVETKMSTTENTSNIDQHHLTVIMGEVLRLYIVQGELYRGRIKTKI